MKDEEKTKVQLIKEMQKMSEKVAGLEEGSKGGQVSTFDIS